MYTLTNNIFNEKVKNSYQYSLHIKNQTSQYEGLKVGVNQHTLI